MSRFTELLYDESTTYVTAGAGLVWDDIYNLLVPLNRNALGSRALGVGISGFILGGGTLTDPDMRKTLTHVLHRR